MSESISSSQIFIPYETIGFCRESTVKGALLAGVIFSLIIATFAASALLLPHTSFGMAMASVGESTLLYGTMVSGILGSALASTLLVLVIIGLKNNVTSDSYLSQDSGEALTDGPIEEKTSGNKVRLEERNVGIFYKIKDRDGNTVGYLLGTIHKMPMSWKGVNATIIRKLEKSKKVFFENIDTIETSALFSIFDNGIDFHVYVHAQQLKKKMVSLDDKKIQKRLIELKKGGFVPARDVYFARSIAAWLAGRVMDPIAAQNDILREQINSNPSTNSFNYQTRNQQDKEKIANCYRVLSEMRNKRWVRKKLSKELSAASKDSKIFIAVGDAHLWDWQCEEFEFLGLIPLLQAEGWSFEKVG